MKIWQRYFLRKLSTTFFFLLFCLFSVYVMVDLSVNGVRFFTRGNSIGLDILIYYGLQFCMQLDLFLPLAYLLTTLKTLADLNGRLELVALQTAGLSKKQLLQPFFVFALFLTFLGLANHEWIAPGAINDVNAFKRSKARKNHRPQTVQSILLEDGSELVYQTFDAAAGAFSDVFWIRSAQDIWMMKTLVFTEQPTGHYVEHLERSQDGLIEKTSTEELHIFNDMKMCKGGIPKQITPFEGRPLSSLFRDAFLQSSQKASVQTHLHRKLALPLLPLLAVFGIAPFAMTFDRHRKTLRLLALSLFIFSLFMTIYDSLVLLGENRMIYPSIAMWVPILLSFSLALWKFRKLR